MPYPHLIRLRGPWDYEPLARSGAPSESLPPAGRMVVPGDWGAALGPDFRGRVRFRRHFHLPTGLEPHEQVWLVLDGLDAHGLVRLNTRPLGSTAGYALASSWEITTLLTAQNDLEIEVECPADRGASTADRPGRTACPGGIVGEVRLEIRAGYAIEHLAVFAMRQGNASTLGVRGTVRGQSGALTLVASTPGGELIYEQVAPDVDFSFERVVDGLPEWPSDHTPADLLPVEIKLLAGGQLVWEGLRATAADRPQDCDRLERQLADAGRLVRMPALDTFSSPAALAGAVSRGACLLSEQVWPDRVYTLCDQANVALVQRLPPAWLGEVGPRLAHHPSIVGWCWPGTPPAGLSFGRPWLDEDHVHV